MVPVTLPQSISFMQSLSECVYTTPLLHSLGVGRGRVAPQLVQLETLSNWEVKDLAQKVDLVVQLLFQGAKLKILQGGSSLFDLAAPRLLQKLGVREVKSLLDQLATLPSEEKEVKKQLLSLLTEGQVTQALNLTKDQVKLALRADRSLAGYIQETRPSVWEEESRSFSDAFLNFIPSLLSAVHFVMTYFEEGQLPDMIWEVYLILGIYYRFFMIPASFCIAAGFFITSGITAYLVAAGVAVVGLGVIYGYLRYLKPCPKNLAYGAVNWTEKARKKEFPKAAYRPELLELLKFQMTSSRHLKKHVLIVGKPGTGKTTLARELASLLAEKEETKHLQVFAMKPGTLAKPTNGVTPATKLTRIKKQLGPHARDTRLVLDEFDSLVPQLGAHLKTVLDEGEMGYIATTTTQGYQNIMGNQQVGPELLERFHILFLEDPDPENALHMQALKTMAATHIFNHQEPVLVEAGAIDAAVECKEPKLAARCQPRLGCDLLDAALARVAHRLRGQPEASEELAKAEKAYQEALRTYQMDPNRLSAPEKMGELEEAVRKTQEALEAERSKEQERGEKMRRVGELVSLIRDEDRRGALLAANGGSPVEYLFGKYIQKPFWMRRVEELEREVGDVSLRVTAEVIQAEIALMVKNLPTSPE